MKEIITQKLSNLDPIKLDIIDESSDHSDHFNSDELETHFRLLIISDYFLDMTKIQRHRIIYKLLEEELKNKIHALSIRALTRLEKYDL